MAIHRNSKKEKDIVRETKVIVRKLRKEIPDNTGCEGCGECCGPILLLPTEVTTIAHMLTRKGLWPLVAKNMQRAMADKTIDGDDWDTCPLLYIGSDQKGKRLTECLVYSHRPIVCKLYNNVPDLKCPRTKWPWSSNYRPSKWLKKYFNIMKGRQVYLQKELMSIIRDADEETQKKEDK